MTMIETDMGMIETGQGLTPMAEKGMVPVREIDQGMDMTDMIMREDLDIQMALHTSQEQTREHTDMMMKMIGAVWQTRGTQMLGSYFPPNAV